MPERNTAHRDLVALLRDSAILADRLVALDAVTLSGKRPDAVSLDSNGELIVWEVKTRYSTFERTQAWNRYGQSCDRLIMVYPPTIDLSWWHRPSWLPADPLARRCGAVVCSAVSCEVLQWPQRTIPDPASLMHLTQQLLRKGFSKRPIFNAPG